MPDLQALYRHLDKIKNKAFHFHVHDCFMFTNDAWKEMYGYGWADDWCGRYIKDTGLYMKPKELRKEFGFETLEEAVDSKLTRVTHVPPRGALVATDQVDTRIIGKAFGISVGNKAAFLQKTGVTYVPIKVITDAWVQ